MAFTIHVNNTTKFISIKSSYVTVFFSWHLNQFAHDILDHIL